VCGFCNYLITNPINYTTLCAGMSSNATDLAVVVNEGVRGRTTQIDFVVTDT
jgi:hypothetical protein